MALSQLEKVLINTAFNGIFTERLIEYGASAKTRYACSEKEGQILDLLLEDQGEGLISILNVMRAIIETRRIIQNETTQSSVLMSGAINAAITSQGGLLNSHIG